MSIQFNSMAIVAAAVCVSLSAGNSSAKANDFQSALNNHLTSGSILLAQDDTQERPSWEDRGKGPPDEEVRALDGGPSIEDINKGNYGQIYDQNESVRGEMSREEFIESWMEKDKALQ